MAGISGASGYGTPGKAGGAEPGVAPSVGGPPIAWSSAIANCCPTRAVPQAAQAVALSGLGTWHFGQLIMVTPSQGVIRLGATLSQSGRAWPFAWEGIGS